MSDTPTTPPTPQTTTPAPTTPAPTSPTDEVDLVHGAAAEAALRTAAEQLGGQLVRSVLRSVDHRPGRGATAVHDLRVRLDGGVVDHVLGLTTDAALIDAADGADGTLVLTSGEHRLGVWRLPHDPSLPGLVPAMDPGAVATLLRSCGVPARPQDVTLDLRSYRPRRRAVVEAAARGATGGSLFLKVVPPPDARALHERHRELTAAGVPAPRSLGYDPRGVVVLERLAGSTWRHGLRGGRPDPPAEELWRAVDRLPDSLLQAPRRPSWSEQSWHHVQLLCAARPAAADEVRALAQAADVAAAVAELPVVPVHGDLYEAQVMVSSGRLSGLLDLDTAGPGHRVDDEACVLAHLALLPLAHPEATAACSTAFDRHLVRARTEPELLWRRTALVLLTLATGPARNRRPGWRQRTDEWLALPAAALRTVGERPWGQGHGTLPRLLAAARDPGLLR